MGIVTRAAAQARSAESGLANPAAWLVDMLGGGSRAATGDYVSRETALQTSPMLAAVRVFSMVFATVPCHTYRQVSEDEREVAKDLPLYEVLRHQANREVTAQEFRELVAQDMLDGDHYSEIEFDGAGRVVALWPREKNRVTVRRRYGQAGPLVYEYQNPVRGLVEIPDWRMFHVPGFAKDGVHGRSLIQLGRNSIGLAMALDTFLSKLFKNGLFPSGLLQWDHHFKDTPDKEAFLNDFAEAFGGAKNAGKTPLLERGIKFNSTTMEPTKAQSLENRQFQVAEASRVTGVQPHLLSDLANAHHTNIEQQSLEFLVYTMLPWFSRFAARCRMKLLSREDTAAGVYVEHDYGLLLQADVKTWAEASASMVRSGLITPNEARRQRNLRPVAGGDRPRMESNLVLIGDDGKPQPIQPPAKAAAARARK